MIPIVARHVIISTKAKFRTQPRLCFRCFSVSSVENFHWKLPQLVLILASAISFFWKMFCSFCCVSTMFCCKFVPRKTFWRKRTFRQKLTLFCPCKPVQLGDESVPLFGKTVHVSRWNWQHLCLLNSKLNLIPRVLFCDVSFTAV